MERARLYVFAAVFFCVVLVGTLGFMRIESLTALDALYFSVVTVATVGYGDIHPVTPMGKLLAANSEFLVRLLEHPNILEHETFTSLLQAVFHLKEELSHRPKLDALPDCDREHLRLDLKRIYSQILLQWLHYLDHIKDNYPYFFSFQCRVTPFLASEDATVCS